MPNNITLRHKIGFWFTLVWGIILASFQMYKYITNTLDESLTLEICVSVFAFLLLVAPFVLLQIIKKKLNDKN